MPDLVALDLPAGPDFVEALERTWAAGHAALPVDQQLPPAGRTRLLEAMAPTAVDDGGGRRALDGGRPVEPGDALVVPTSGSTGEPKGVVLTQAAVVASAHAGSERLGVDPHADTWLACLPLTHLAGLGVVTRSLLTGTPLLLRDRPDADGIASALDEGATLTTLVPTALRRVGVERFRRIVVGGADVPADLPDNAVTSYGLTETCGGCVYDGVAFDGVEIDVDATGVIRVRGPMLLRAYRDGRVPLDAAGWLHTGDLGHLDERGRLVIDGRSDDLIISGGENIWPGPVEDAVRDLEGVADVAVVGRPDPEWGQRVVAVIETVPGARPPSLESVRAIVRERLHPWCAPRELELVDALPRTRAGKVRRASLRS